MGTWTKLIADVKYMTLAWKKKDTERAKVLRQQSRTKEFELLGGIIANAVARVFGKK